MTSTFPVRTYRPAESYFRARSHRIRNFRSFYVPVLAFSLFAFFFFVGSVKASSVMVEYTVSVELLQQSGNQPAPNITLAIFIFDTVSNTGFSRYARTNAQGSFSDTGTFQCTPNDNQYGYVIGAVKIRTSGAIEGGGSTSGGTSCATPGPATPLILAVSSLDYNFDGHNAGLGCPKVGEPVNVTNGNMYIRHSDYFLPGNGEPIHVSRHYNSQVTDTGYFGIGWTSDIDERLVNRTHRTSGDIRGIMRTDSARRLIGKRRLATNTTRLADACSATLSVEKITRNSFTMAMTF